MTKNTIVEELIKGSGHDQTQGVEIVLSNADARSKVINSDHVIPLIEAFDLNDFERAIGEDP